MNSTIKCQFPNPVVGQIVFPLLLFSELITPVCWCASGLCYTAYNGAWGERVNLSLTALHELRKCHPVWIKRGYRCASMGWMRNKNLQRDCEFLEIISIYAVIRSV